MNEIPNTFPSLFFGYTIIWAILAGYVYSLITRVRKLEQGASSRVSGELDKQAEETTAE